MKKTIFAIILMTCILNFSFGQVGQTPKPIDLGIQNITQQTSSWCWAATAQQVIYWLTGKTPHQCFLVANSFNRNPQVCCNNPQACNSPGYMHQIQKLILDYGGHYSSISPPTNEMSVYQTLAKGKAIILFLQTTPYVGHFVVLRGMAWVPKQFGYQSIFYINDPMSYFTEPVSFSKLRTIWRAAIVIY